jgi:hypothetical protein
MAKIQNAAALFVIYLLLPIGEPPNARHQLLEYMRFHPITIYSLSSIE